MTTVKSEIIINRHIDDVFRYMASPHNGPAFIPYLSENANIFPKKDGVGQKFDYKFNMVGVELVGTAEVTVYDPPHKVVMSSEGDSDSKWTYIMEEVEGGTKVKIQIDYELSETALQRIANMMVINKIAQKTVEQMAENLKVILESN